VTLFHTPLAKTAARIISVRRHKGDHAMRIDLLFFRDKIKRVLVITSDRLRGLLRKPRRIELPDVQRPADTQLVIREAHNELMQLSSSNPRKQRVQALDTARAVSEEAHAAVRRAVGASAPVAGNSNVTAGIAGKTEKPRKTTDAIGTLTAFGRDKREMHGKMITHFFVDVTDDASGKVTRLWGTDLQRALAEAKAVAGDRIQVRDFGYVPCIIPDTVTDPDGSVRRTQKTVDKRVFAIEKINEEK
jgi:hypothetical protein